MEHIYALYHYLGTTDKVYFYVGRSSRSSEIRFAEHRANVINKKHTEDVYQYIRNEVLCTVFEQEILCEVNESEVNDYEDFYVIDLIQKGHKLQNMKHGDAKSIALLNEANILKSAGTIINNPQELRVYRDSEKLRLEVLNNKSNHTSAVQSFFSAYNIDITEQRKVNKAKAEKKAIKDKARAIEKAEWIMRGGV